jgi:hypothetical protein
MSSLPIASTPARSFVGGIGLGIAAWSLTLLNGSVFGISGFLHRAVKGEREAVSGVAGLVIAGMCIGLIEGKDSQAISGIDSVFVVLLSGLLVGLGTKVC